MSTQPREASAQLAQEAIAEEFEFLGDWTERYQHLIDMGRLLPEFPEQDMQPGHQVHGCQSQVWLTVRGDNDCLQIRAISDSAIVSGLIALLLRVYSGRSAQEVVATKPDFINHIGLSQHLSPTRSNGLVAMLQAIRNAAQAALDGDPPND